MEVHNTQKLKERRRELRKRATLQENSLWEQLRNNKLGVKFKRQHSIGGYILDFYCAEKKIIIELDGEVHATEEAKEYDEVRDKFFRELGYKTIRFWNSEIESAMGNVLQNIKQICESL